MILNDFEKGYLAAIIDGEGTIHITKRFEKKRQRHFLYAEIIVANTSISLLKKTKKIIGGWIQEINVKSKPNHKTLYILHKTDMATMRSLLIVLIPYLIVKKPQAKLMVEYCKNRLAVGKTWSKAYAPRDFEIQEEMKKLNKRGLKEE